MQHFDPAKNIGSYARVSMMTDSIIIHDGFTDIDFVVTNGIEALPVEEFHIECEPIESFSVRELKAHRRLAKKIRQQDRRSLRAAKRSQYAI